MILTKKAQTLKLTSLDKNLNKLKCINKILIYFLDSFNPRLFHYEYVTHQFSRLPDVYKPNQIQSKNMLN